MLHHENLSYEMILQKVFFLIFLISFGVQAVHLEEKVRKGVYAHFEKKWGSLKSIV